MVACQISKARPCPPNAAQKPLYGHPVLLTGREALCAVHLAWIILATGSVEVAQSSRRPFSL